MGTGDRRRPVPSRRSSHSPGRGTPVGVKRPDPTVVQRQLTRSIPSSTELKTSTRNSLFQHDLVTLWDDDPRAAIDKLQDAVAKGTARRNDVYALAEISFAYGEGVNDRRTSLVGGLRVAVPLPGRTIPARSFDPRAPRRRRHLQPRHRARFRVRRRAATSCRARARIRPVRYARPSTSTSRS